jgi:hypothetical protein
LQADDIPVVQFSSRGALLSGIKTQIKAQENKEEPVKFMGKYLLEQDAISDKADYAFALSKAIYDTSGYHFR